MKVKIFSQTSWFPMEGEQGRVVWTQSQLGFNPSLTTQ